VPGREEKARFLLNGALMRAPDPYRLAAHFNHLFSVVNFGAVFIKLCVTSSAESNGMFTVFGRQWRLIDWALFMGKTIDRLLQGARRFLRSERGNVAMMFGLALVPMVIAGGVGLDYARSALVRSQMADALDAAALAVGSTTGLDQAGAQALAQKYFNANYTGDTSNGLPIVTIAPNGYVSTGSVTVTANYSLPTTLLRVIGKNTVDVGTSTTVVWGQSKLWVALVLDNSGSMANGDSTGSKMDALQNASHQLLSILQNAATNDGDVKVSIVPFDRIVNVGTTNVSASWIDWTDWEAPPTNISALDGTDGPGTSCPFTSGANGFRCTTGSANGSSTTNTIPASGMICPSIDSGSINTAHRARYYNGCWDSVITQTQTATKTDTTPITIKQNCSQKGTGTITCTTSSTTNGSVSSSTATTTSSGYTGDSTTSSSNTVTNNTVDGTKTCTGSGTKTCTWVRTITQTKTDTTVTKTAYGGYTHTWQKNSHSTWTGCIMDRDKTYDYDISNTAPSTTATGFPAMNMSGCLSATITPLGYDWTTLGNKIDAMAPNNSTNQAIGMAQGWQTLTNTDPFNPGTLPSNTTRYIIILSDGLNTQDRWWGDGSTEGTTEDGYIDAREKATCDAAKADGIIIYSIFLNVGGGGSSAPLSYCATDSTKYFALTTTSAVVTTFNQIAQQITNVRVSR
jgi:Flp pilus assembly protein TadG